MRRGKIEVSRQLAAGMPAGVFAGMFITAAWLLASCVGDTGLVPPRPEDAPIAGAAWSRGSEAAPGATTGRAKFGDYVVSGPYTHANLAVYLVHGEDKIKGKSFLTLEEALAKKLAILHETGNVSKLAIENVSLTEEIYVQSGDIVKGGKQDRVIATDFIVPAKSGKMPIASFCVERGRWSQRGRESATLFLVSDGQLSTKALKMAAKKSGSQQEVWREVANAQRMLASNVGAASAGRGAPGERRPSSVGPVVIAQTGQRNVQTSADAQTNVPAQAAPQTQQRLAFTSADWAGAQTVMAVQSAESPSSLQLTLENKKVKEATEKYTKALSGVVEGRDDAIGFAFAINGGANSADLYASRALFRKLWPKLLRAAAVEAVAELKKDERVKHPAAGTLVAEFFTKLDKEGEKVAVSEKDITKRVRMKTKEGKEVIQFDTFDRAAADMLSVGAAAPAKARRVPVHTNLIKK